MWKASRISTLKPDHASMAAVLFDKLHVMRRLGKALDKGRRKQICPAGWQVSRLQQGSEIHVAVPPGASDAPWAKSFEKAAGRQQATEHRLSPQGVLEPALGLREGRVGANTL